MLITYFLTYFPQRLFCHNLSHNSSIGFDSKIKFPFQYQDSNQHLPSTHIYVLLNRSCGTFSCAFYTYVLLPTSPGIFQCTFSTYVPPATFTATFKLTFSLYVPKTQRNAQEKGMFPHRNIPSFIMYLFFQFCQFIAVHIRRMTALIMAC